MNRIGSAIALAALCTVGAGAMAQGGIFVTGHDADWHAIFAQGPRNIIGDSIAFVTNHNVAPKILFVTDTRNIGLDSRDTRPGMTAAGFTYDVADDGTAGGSFLNLATVNFADYNAIVVASSGGGLLHQSELDILNARSNDMIDYINGGGGLVAFAESTEYPGGTNSHFFGFMPFVVQSSALPQVETSIRVTPYGASLGLTDADVSVAFSHNSFSTTGGMNVVDRDDFGNGNIISLAYYGKITSTGPVTVPEPGVVALAASGTLFIGGLMRRRRRTHV